MNDQTRPILGAEAATDERREHPRLALEPSQPVGICRDPLEQQFDRHVAAEVHIPGTPDFAHSACTEAVEDFVLA